VKYAEPDSEVHMIPEIEAGPEAATWGLNRVGADERGRNGAGATVFVLDTGVRVSHQEFSGRAVPALDMTSGSPVECNGDLTCAGDVQGHGTHCAGTAAGESFGVAPSASVRSVKVLGDNGSGSWSWSYGALDWLASNQVRPAVASMSLGGSGTQQAMRDAVDGAVNAGVVVVVAGGNSNSDACNFSPAFVPSAITVGSTTSTDARSSFSNYGACTNIWAPGSSVVSASHTSDTGSRSLSGTSMACPHVSGGAALVLEANPSMKASAVLQQLLDDAYLNVLTDLKFGDTNALLCVAEGGAPPTPTPQPTPAPPPGTWTIDGSGCVEDGASCISSLNHPGNYGNNQVCNIVLAGSVSISVSAFNTESGYDTLSMGGSSYSGTSAPPSGSYTGVISWNSDYSVTRSGWKLCKN
jgi:subtilisin family serine protease